MEGDTPSEEEEEDNDSGESLDLEDLLGPYGAPLPGVVGVGALRPRADHCPRHPRLVVRLGRATMVASAGAVRRRRRPRPGFAVPPGLVEMAGTRQRGLA